MDIQAEPTGTAWQVIFITGGEEEEDISWHSFLWREIVPPLVWPWRVGSSESCAYSTCHCMRKGKAIPSLPPLPPEARRFVTPPMLSQKKLILGFATICCSLTSLICVFISHCSGTFTVIARGLAGGLSSPSTGEDNTPLSGFPVPCPSCCMGWARGTEGATPSCSVTGAILSCNLEYGP